jgi:formyl-CoA transferase
MASLLTFNAGMYFASGQSPKRRGNVHPTISPYETFEASDGWINVGVANDKFWALFCDVIDRKDLESDPRFDAAPKRAANRASLVDILTPIFAARTRAHWLEALRVAGIPAGSIKQVNEVCEAPQLVERGMVQSVPHRVSGDVRFIARPIRFEDQPPPPSTPPPLLGEHTAEILSEWLGWNAPAFEKVAAAGAFGAKAASLRRET